MAAPGSAVRERLSADHAAELADELDPVLSMLAATDARVAADVAAAESEAARITSEAAERAAGIAADGRARAEFARRAAADDVIASARAEANRIENAAAAAVRARRPPAEAEVLALTEHAVRLVVAMQPGAA